jgi:hypothetical protein
MPHEERNPGDGTLAIEAGGSVSGALGQIAVTAGSEGTVLVSGDDAWRVLGWVFVHEAELALIIEVGQTTNP